LWAAFWIGTRKTPAGLQGADDPGVQSVTKVSITTRSSTTDLVMGASFRNIGEIKELAGCDLLTILRSCWLSLRRPKPTCRASSMPKRQRSKNIEKIVVDKAKFDAMHAADRMAPTS